MYKEEIIKHFTILCTSNGYMIEHEDDDGGYEYIHAPNGDVVLKVTADGFDENGIPREKTWERRRPDGLWEKTSYLILKANTAYDAPASEFEFNPPPGSNVSVIGKDGWGVSPSDSEVPAVSRPVNRLWGLNLLAVLVLAAFTIRKFLLRRQTAAGG